MNIDFSKTLAFADKSRVEKLLQKKDLIYKLFSETYMTGWTNKINPIEVERMIKVANKVKNNSQCLVVIGIGGSFLGSYAVDKLLSPYFNNKNFEIIYAGTTLSSAYMNDLIEYLEDKNFSINVISKSGTTLETTITYNLLKKLLTTKYSKEEIQSRIIVTTDELKGDLRKEVNKEGYESFVIPDNIGGRYSIMTPAHLFPLAFNHDIKKLLEGYYSGKELQEDAYKYAVTRKLLNETKYTVENYVTTEEKMLPLTEWLKQLFAESEGKEGKGIFPISTLHTRDLHSLGQFIQEGNKIMFETFLKVESSKELIYNNKNLHDVNNIVTESVRTAHYNGNVPSIEITIEKLDEYNIGKIMYFFMLSAAYSSYLFEVNPFNQPGVEIYKKEVKKNLGEI